MSENTHIDFTSASDVSETGVDASEVDDAEATAFEAYASAVDHDLAETYTPSIVADRLARLKAAEAARSSWHEEDWNYLIEELSAYAFQVVHSWITIIAHFDEPSGSGHITRTRMSGQDVETLAGDVITRAVNGFRQELDQIRWWLRQDLPEMKTLFLLECVLQLPDAFRSWRLSRSLTDELDEMAEYGFAADDHSELLRRIYVCVHDDKPRTVQVLKAHYSEAEVDDIVAVTLSVFDLASGGAGRPGQAGRK
jgi:hypothetical protein